ncbi:trypsin-like serine protease [Streptomyces melanogenes]|uniref:trypsin-like serine protease n=1 Tax=Streptomyces melanogenes TaxID=67326 RepID=UPI0037A43824
MKFRMPFTVLATLTVALVSPNSSYADSELSAASIPKTCGEGEHSTRIALCEEYQPQGGGVKIHVGGPNRDYCTTGFGVWKPDAEGNRDPYSLTAAHCTIGNTRDVYTGEGKFLGNLTDIRYTLTQDSALLKGNETYKYFTEVVFSGGPESSKSLTVRGQSTPAKGDTVCASGATTGEVCNVALKNTVPKCVKMYEGDKPVDRCGLIEAYRPGKTVVDDGDSGGPVYQKKDAYTVNAVGIIIGGGNDGQTLYYEPIAAVLQSYGVTLATCWDTVPNICE